MLAKFIAMPPPIVPAPMMPTFLTGIVARVVRHVRNLPHLALGEEHVALRRRLRAGHQLHEQLALGRDALHRTAGSPPLRCSGCCTRARGSRGTCARWPCGTRRRSPACRARLRTLSFRSRTLLQRPLLGDDFLRERDRAGAQLALGHDLVEQAGGERRSSHRRARRTSPSRSACSGPTMRGRRCVPPAPGSRPRCTSGKPHFADGTATR